MKITTILFDFVGVLLEPDPAVVVLPLIERIDQRIGQVVDDRAFRETTRHDYGLTETQFETALAQIVNRYKAFAPLWQMLPELQKGYRLGIINNGTWLTYQRFNEKYGIEQQFAIFVSSAVEGVRKPDSAIYLRACQKLGVLPEQCLFLDDSEANVSGATAVGMQGMWWETPDAGLHLLRRWLASQEGARTGNGI